MNGHTTAVKLLLDMVSDINAQIEMNCNTAMTLACFPFFSTAKPMWSTELKPV